MIVIGLITNDKTKVVHKRNNTMVTWILEKTIMELVYFWYSSTGVSKLCKIRTMLDFSRGFAGGCECDQIKYMQNSLKTQHYSIV